MGIFYEQQEVINRTSKLLHVRFDGQDIEIRPNYTADGQRIPGVHNSIPTVTVPYAKSQNVLMGSEDAIDPSAWETLVAVKARDGEKQRDDMSFCEQSGELTRVKLADLLDDPTLEIKVGGRRVRPSEARPENSSLVPFEQRPT